MGTTLIVQASYSESADEQKNPGAQMLAVAPCLIKYSGSARFFGGINQFQKKIFQPKNMRLECPLSFGVYIPPQTLRLHRSELLFFQDLIGNLFDLFPM